MTLHPGAGPGPDDINLPDSGVEWTGLDQWENGEMMVYLQHLMGGEVPYPGVGVGAGGEPGAGLF